MVVREPQVNLELLEKVEKQEIIRRLIANNLKRGKVGGMVKKKIHFIMNVI